MCGAYWVNTVSRFYSKNIRIIAFSSKTVALPYKPFWIHNTSIRCMARVSIRSLCNSISVHVIILSRFADRSHKSKNKDSSSHCELGPPESADHGRFLFSFEFRLYFSKSEKKKRKKLLKVTLFSFDIKSTMHTFRTSIPSNCYFQPPTHKNCMFDQLHLSCLSCKFEHKTLIKTRKNE